jgi:hypothetical protein
MYLCRLCGRTFSALKNSLPESAFEPESSAVDPQQAREMLRVKGMTSLVPRNLPADYVAAQGYTAVMIDGIVHEFKQ